MTTIPARFALTLVCLAMAGMTGFAYAQQPPNSGTIARDPALEPQNVLPKPDQPGVAAERPRRAFVQSDVQIKPAEFKFSGNTLISSDQLAAAISDSRDKNLDFNALADLAEKIRALYVARGYPLTDVYFPEQTFAKEGGVVEFAVVEARIGKWSVSVADGSGISKAQAEALVGAHYVHGALIDQYMLDKPVLLLRDLVGVDASATVAPGEAVGESDVAVEIKPSGGRWGFSTSLDNLGAGPTGEYRLGFDLTVNHPLGIGDQLSVRARPTNETGNVLYRLGYSLPLGPYGTKLTGSLSNSLYELGEPFKAAQASGYARVASVSLVHPLVRGRLSSMVAMVGLDRKELSDVSPFAVPKETKRTIETVRFGVLGIRTDAAIDPIFGGGNTTYSAIVTAGHAADNVNQAGDTTLGRFAKLNIDVQRTQFLSSNVVFAVGATGQLASGNLQGAERYSFGGPSGVRGYGVATGTGDQGILLSAELRYRTGFEILGAPLIASGFYDIARVQDRKSPNTVNTLTNVLGGKNFSTFDSFGVGLKVGTEGKFVASAYIAQRIGSPYPIPTGAVAA